MKFIWLPLVLRCFPVGELGTISYNENDRSSPAFRGLEYFPEDSFRLVGVIGGLSCTCSCFDLAELVIRFSAPSEDL